MGKQIAFDINDAAKATGLSKYTLIDALRDGDIVGGRDGKRLVINVESLQRWLLDQGTRMPALTRLLSLRDLAVQESELDDSPRPALVGEAR